MDNIYRKPTTEFLPFQKKGIVRGIKYPVFVLGDATGLGKTIQVLGAYTYLKTEYPDLRMIFLADKSSTVQIVKEVDKFFTGLTVHLSNEMDKTSRISMYEKWLAEGDILVTNYAPLRGDLVDPDYLRCSVYSDVIPEMKKARTIKGKYGELAVSAKGTMTYKADTARIKKSAKLPHEDTIIFTDESGIEFKSVSTVVFQDYRVQVTTRNINRPEREFSFSTSPLPKMIETARVAGIKFFNAYDEAEAFQNSSSGTYKMGRFLSKRAFRSIPMTATLSKGELYETFNILTCMGIPPCDKATFEKNFCVWEPNYQAPKMRYGPRKGKPPLMLTGYKNIAKFKELLSLNYLGRSKKDVAPELPSFTHERYYPEECSGVNSAMVKLYTDAKLQKRPTNVAQLRIATVTPQLIDTTLPEDYLSSPVQDLVRALNHSLVGKVIVYVDYKTPIDLLEKILPKSLPAFYKNILKITGDVSDRDSVISLFRDSKDHNLLFLNSAGRRGLNLQFVEDMWFLVDPLTGGDYQQICGRISRIGSDSERFTIHKSIVKDSPSEDVQGIIQSDLRFMYNLAPNTVDDGLIEEGYDSIRVPDVDAFLLKRFTNRADRYIGQDLQI